MVGLLLPSIVAAVVGLARGSSHSRGFHFIWWPVVVVTFAVELVLYNPPVDTYPIAITFGPWIWVATKIALLAALLRNSRLRRAWSVPPWAKPAVT